MVNKSSAKAPTKFFLPGFLALVVLIGVVILILVIRKNSYQTLVGDQASDNKSTQNIPATQPVLYPGTVYLTIFPSSVAAGEEFRAVIYLDTKGVNITLAKVVLRYNPTTVEFQGVNYDNSVLSMKLREEKDVGRLSMTLGEPGDADFLDNDDGFTGSQGIFAELTFKALGKGAADLALVPGETAMFLDDANGTRLDIELKNKEVIINQ